MPRKNRRIAITYEIVGQDEHGEVDVLERGWEDEEGVDMEPDEVDHEEGVTAVDKAIAFLEDQGVAETSSSRFGPDVWYTSHPSTDYSTGDQTTRSFHLKGFPEDEQKELFSRLFPRASRPNPRGSAPKIKVEGMEHLLTWKGNGFRLELYDTRRYKDRHSMLAYRFYDGKRMVFEGDDYGCAPGIAVDSPASVGGLLGFLSLKPGDTDPEYFEGYTKEQMRFAEDRGDELNLHAIALEEAGDDWGAYEMGDIEIHLE